MENKMFKKLAAAGTALMMAVTGMAVNVSADSWSVYQSNSQAGTKTQDDRIFYASSSTSSFKDSCETYNQAPNAIGLPAYVNYYAFYYVNGQFTKCTSTDRYYYNTQSLHTVPMTKTFSSSAAFYVLHNLNLNGNACSINGIVSKS